MVRLNLLTITYNYIHYPLYLCLTNYLYLWIYEKLNYFQFFFKFLLILVVRYVIENIKKKKDIKWIIDIKYKL